MSPTVNASKVVEHLPPQAVDRAVALVDDHDVEELGRERRVVLDRDELAGDLERRMLFELLVEHGVAAED